MRVFYFVRRILWVTVFIYYIDIDIDIKHIIKQKYTKKKVVDLIKLVMNHESTDR